MPALQERVEELAHANPTIATTVSTAVTELHRSLYTIRNRDDSAEVIVGPHILENQAGEGVTGAINFTIFRTLWMISFDYVSLSAPPARRPHNTHPRGPVSGSYREGHAPQPGRRRAGAP